MGSKGDDYLKHSPTTGSFVVVIGVIIIATNIAAILRLHRAKLKNSSVVCLKILSGTCIALASMMTVCACLSLFTRYLGNTTICMLLGVLLRLILTTYYLILMIFYIDILCQSLLHHPKRHIVKIGSAVSILGWIITVVFVQLPLFPMTAYHDYPSPFVCDIQDERTLVTADCLLFCLPALAVLGMSVGVLVSESTRLLNRRISYVVAVVQSINSRPDEESPQMKKTAYAGVAVSICIVLQWVIRVAAVLTSNAESSRSLSTLFVFLLLVMTLFVPICYQLLAQSPVPAQEQEAQCQVVASAQMETVAQPSPSAQEPVSPTEIESDEYSPRMKLGLQFRDEAPTSQSCVMNTPRNSVSCQHSTGSWIVSKQPYN